MAQRDGTGPNGTGAMTGRGMGHCVVGSNYGRGFGRGYGMRMCRGGRFGRGFGWGVQATVNSYSRHDELNNLRQDSENLRKTLEQIEGRIAELKNNNK